MPIIRQEQHLIQHGNYAFSIDIKDAYIHIPIVQHHHHFLHFVWPHKPYQWKILPFWLARVFLSLTEPVLSLCQCIGFMFSYLDDILVLSHSKQAGKRKQTFVLDYTLNCPSLSSAVFFSRTMWGYKGHVHIFTI